MQDRRKRKLDCEWEGDEQDIRSRLLGCKSYEDARYWIVLIRAMRSDLPDEFINCLELHIKIRFGEVDDAFSLLQEIRRENRNFLLSLVIYITDEYRRSGPKGITNFRELFMNYSPDELLDIFGRASKLLGSNACDIWLCLLALRSDLIAAVCPNVLECLKNRCESFHGLLNFGNSIVQTNFQGLMPEQIFLVFDEIIRSSVQECTSAERTECVEPCSDARVNIFLKKTYPFVHAVLKKLGLPLLPLQLKSSEFLHLIIPKLPEVCTPPVIRAVAYVLAVIRIKLPSVADDVAILPSCSRNHQDFATNEPQWFSTLEHLGHLCSKLSLQAEFRQACHLTGSQDIDRWVALALYHTGNYAKGKDFCEKILESKRNSDPMIDCMKLSCHNMLNDVSTAIVDAFPMLQHIKVNKWYSFDQTLFHAASGLNAKYVYCRFSSLGHWLAMLFCNMLSQDSIRKTDVINSCLLVVSQLGGCAYQQLTDTMETLLQQEQFRSNRLVNYLVDPVVLEQVLCLASQSEKSIDLGKEFTEAVILPKIQSTPNPNEIVQSIVEYFTDNSACILTQVIK